MRHTAPAMSAPHAARPFTHSKKRRPPRASPPNPKCAARPGHLRLTPNAPPVPGISAQSLKRRPCSAGQTLRLSRSLERAGRTRCRPASQDAPKPLSPAPLTPPPLKSETAAFLLSRVRSMRKFVICSLASHDILSKGFLILTVRVGGSARWGHITYMEETWPRRISCALQRQAGARASNKEEAQSANVGVQFAKIPQSGASSDPTVPQTKPGVNLHSVQEGKIFPDAGLGNRRRKGEKTW